MCGYFVSCGYFGRLPNGRYMLFASEQDYYDYTEGNDADGNAA